MGRIPEVRRRFVSAPSTSDPAPNLFHTLEMSSDTQACDRCHRRKTKCDKIRPECGQCVKAEADCLYSEKSKEPVYRRDFVERLERRARQLEATNRALTERLASVRKQRQDSANSTLEETPREPQPPDDLRTSNDIANEVSFLSTAAGGDRQFLGSASGLLFANLVKASVVTTTERDPDGTLSALSNLNGTGNGTQGKPEWSINDGSLPPPQLARRLIEAYLAHDHLSYPCIHPESVRSVIDSIYKESSFYRKHPFEAFMFNMLLAIGTSQVHKFNWQALPDAETHHLRAMLHLNAVLCDGGLKALQAMLLLCQFRLSSSTKDTSGSLWHLVGIAARMCLELGLHRESVYRLKPSDRHVDGPISSISRFEEQQVRRRCFWCVFALDRFVSITLGRPLAICLEDVDVDLPNVEIEDAITPSVASAGDEQDLSRIAPNYRTAIFVHIVRYRALCGKVLTSLHRGSRTAVQPDSELRRIRGELSLELESWRADTNALNLPEMDFSSPLAEARSSFRSKAWYELLYHNGILLLYRPTPMLSPSDSSGDDGDLQRLFTAAKQSITLYAYLFRSRKINFSWMVLHAVFMAGLSYVYALTQNFREKRRRRTAPISTAILSRDPTVMEIVNDCRACSNVLVAVSERCNAQKNCHEVFDRLSDAVLADAVDLLSGHGYPESQNRHQNKSHISNGVQYGGAQDSQQYTSTSSTAAVEGIPRNFHPNAIRPGPTAPETDAHPSSIDLASDGYSSVLMQRQQMPCAPPLAADSALRDCFPDLQRIYDNQWGDDAILQLSMDWLEDIEPGNGVFMNEAIGSGFM